ncbi:uncharacterized protein MYCGRDRAFT_105223 [Zymoseptoria tritici IPO323]|uniref:Cell wall protein PhiA n=1 Tax=Zymoseptoria tritici (strain CBS 115943 / IPO323) TaxID=336722 RepID=F9XFW9_ZYMTI|nr:uncharacterized protein MYCGRDRAFT_105223 [Zymoseptoria tritici IPO323]EGP86107.1 hypothetical protein MYCGRDRAFT_105223 [Zymoseptoria tritici IPO323]
MQYSALALLTAVTSVMAAPQHQRIHVDFPPPQLNQAFGVNVTGPGITNVDTRAMNGGIFIGGPQKANCEDNFHADFATYIARDDHTWKLYNNKGGPTQMLYVDNKGSVGYTTGDVGAPPHTERDPFNIDPTTGYVTFNGCSAKACPTGAEKDQYTLWFTNDDPYQQKDCVDVTVQAYYTPYRPSCTYN